MRCLVHSGDYTVTLEGSSPKEAAIAALMLWSLKAKKPKLCKITTVDVSGLEQLNFLTGDLLDEVTLQQPSP